MSTFDEMKSDAADSLVAGRILNRTINDFIASCAAQIAQCCAEPAPDNALVSLLCDAVRLAREYGDAMSTDGRG